MYMRKGLANSENGRAKCVQSDGSIFKVLQKYPTYGQVTPFVYPKTFSQIIRRLEQCKL